MSETAPSIDEQPVRPPEPLAKSEGSWQNRMRRNVAALSVARGAVAVSTLLLTAYLTRTLEPQAYGILGFGSALLTYFVLLATLGFDKLGTREIARSPERALVLTGQITAIKLILGTLAYVLFLGTVLLLPKPPLFRLVLAVQGLAIFAYAISVEWVYEGVERMGILALRNVAVALLHLGSVLLLVHAPEDVVLAAAAGVAALFALNVWLLFSLVRGLGRVRLSAPLTAWRTLLPPALPIAASTFMIAIYYNLDQVMLGLFRGEAEVGWYTASCRALSAVLMPAMVVTQAFFPTLSAAFGDAEAMRERARAFAAAMIPLGVPFGIAMALLAQPMLVLFAGADYAPGGPALSLLMINASLVYLNIVYGQPLLAWNRQRAYMLAVGSGAGANIVLNFLLIPPFGMVGAAAATLAAEAAVFCWVWIVHRQITHAVYAGVVGRTAVATLAGVVAPIGIGLYMEAPASLLLVVAAVIYSGIAWWLDLVPRAALFCLLSRLRSPSA